MTRQARKVPGLSPLAQQAAAALISAGKVPVATALRAMTDDELRAVIREQQ